MKVAVQGTREFSDYLVFMRAMGVALNDVDNGEFHVYSAGPANINSYMSEFCNTSERSLRSRGIKVRFYKIPPSSLEASMKNFDYFAYFSTPNQRPSKLVDAAELAGVEVGIFRY
jgi:hypothetical protein